MSDDMLYKTTTIQHPCTNSAIKIQLASG